MKYSSVEAALSAFRANEFARYLLYDYIIEHLTDSNVDDVINNKIPEDILPFFLRYARGAYLTSDGRPRLERNEDIPLSALQAFAAWASRNPDKSP